MLLGLTLCRLKASHAIPSEAGQLSTKVIWTLLAFFCVYLTILLCSSFDYKDFSLYRIIVDVFFYETILAIQILEVYILMSYDLADYVLVPVVLKEG